MKPGRAGAEEQEREEELEQDGVEEGWRKKYMSIYIREKGRKRKPDSYLALGSLWGSG